MGRQYGALRGLAILIVVLYHSTEWATLGPAGLGYPPAVGWERAAFMTFRTLGMFAVPTFLFISGCFAAYSARGDPPTMSLKIVWAGLSRMLWPYAIWSAIYYAAIYVLRQETYTVFGYLKNLIVGYPFHFVPILLFFYVLSPLLVRVAKRHGGLVVAAFGLYQLILMNIEFPGVLGFTFPNWMRYIAPPVLGASMAQWGVSYPLGLVYGLHTRGMRSWLYRLRWILLGLTGAAYVLAILNVLSVVRAGWVTFVGPLPFLLYSTTISRGSIPMVRPLEQVGRRSYGLYLSHLIVQSFVFLGVQTLVPWLLGVKSLLLLVMFLAGLLVPMGIMAGLSQRRAQRVYRIVFG